MMSPRTPELDVLMYHSISDGDGPTCISPATFRMQLDLLADLGYQTVSLTQVADWLRGQTLPNRSVLITFDDGFVDFAEVAWPLLQARGLGAVVFLPTGCAGGYDAWESTAGHAARPIMSWDQVRHLGGQGVEFGGHSVHHEDLTRLPASQALREVEESQRALQIQLGQPVLAFAPPFGRSNAAIRAMIGQSYRLSFGTVLGRATQRSDVLDLPRVEMHYFRHPTRWRTHLSGGGQWWFAMRRSLRAVRSASLARFQHTDQVSSTQ